MTLAIAVVEKNIRSVMGHKKYNILVRDKIPAIIRKNGDSCVTHMASDDEYWSKLKEKLQEEVLEFIKSEDISEIADIMEVIDAIIKQKKLILQILLRSKKRSEQKEVALIIK